MAGLLGALSVASRALEAQTFGLEVTSQNIANVNTPGYTRRVADLRAVPPADFRSAGRGVEVGGTRAPRDLLLERRLREETSIEQRHSALSEVLGQVETLIGLPGQSVDAEMERFFDAYARLAEDPTSSAIRQQMTHEGRALADAFHGVARRMSDVQRDADRHVRAEVETIDELTAKIASFNEAMSTTAPGHEPHEERDAALQASKELAQHLDVVVLEQQDGRGFDVYSLSGRALVVGTDSHALSAVSAGPSGFADVVYDGATVTADVGGGRLEGYLLARDTLVPGYTDQLDELAYSFVQQVNAVHDAGFDLSGIDAGNFFTPLAAQAGAAAGIGVDPAVAAAPALVAAAAVPSAGDNQTARTIASLRDQLVLDANTSTFNGFWANLALRVGRDAESAADALDHRSDAVRQIESFRDAVSGVSLSEEALELMKFQRAYEANAAMFRTIDETLDTLMGLVRI